MLALDYDGTLAPIVPDPERAVPDARALETLSELIDKVQQVAIISGRDTDFLARQLPLAGLLLVGNHGLEERRDGGAQLASGAMPYLDALRQAGDSLKELEAPAGTIVEAKHATIAVHFRQSPDPATAAAALTPVLERIAGAAGLVLDRGRLVFELRPPVAIDKGTVLRRLLEQMHPAAVIYAGDDRTDADAFRSLRELAGNRLATLAVGVRSPEVPAQVFRDTDLVIDGIPGMVAFLGELRAALTA